jgi:hypothetical protein
MNLRCRLAGVMLFGCVVQASGYELATHGNLTYQAFLQSQLTGDPTAIFANGLGLGQGAYTDLGTTYFDVSGSTVTPRQIWKCDFDENKWPGNDPAAATTTRGRSDSAIGALQVARGFGGTRRSGWEL